MNSSRRPLVDRKHIRRNVKRAHQFKENQVLVNSDPKNKSNKRKKNDERQVAIESVEFQLLVQLYVPANLLIKNNRVLMKQLNAYLPVLVSERYQEVNFELHILLSSLVTTYVSSWYCQKLNTDDIQFVREIYQTLCFFIQDFSNRISDITLSPRLLELVNEMAGILDKHLQDNFVEGGVPKYVSVLLNRSSHNVLETSDVETLKNTYLRESHVSFDQKWAFGTYTNIDSTNSLPNICQHGSSHQVYQRILIKNILRTVFANPKNEVQGPESSEILTNFLTILLADMVLTKVTTKLSDPEFIISTVIGSLAEKLNAPRKNKKAKAPSFLQKLCLHKVRSFFWGFQTKLIRMCCVLGQHSQTSKQYPSIFFSPVLSLANTITNFSNRKPVLKSVLISVRSIVFSIGGFGKQIENITAAYILEKFYDSPITDDTFLSQKIRSLRSSLFDKSNSAQPRESSVSKRSISVVANDLFNWFRTRAKHGSPLNIFLNSFAFEGETDEQLKSNIESFLRLFDSREGPGDMTESTKDLNLLLVMKLLDCLVGYLYPEMTSEF